MGSPTRPLEARAQKPVEGPAPGRKVGYLVAAVLDGVLLYVVNHLLAWEWPPFLTDDFSRVLTIFNVSLVASLVVNLVWIVADPVLLKSTSQIALNIISLVVTVRIWRVFPFDFSAYAFPWATLVRAVLAVGLFGLVVGSIVEFVKMVRWAVRGGA